MSIKRLQVGAKKGGSKKLIAIRADQFLAHNQSSITARAPNILKRNDSKSGKLFINSVSNTMVNCPPLTSTTKNSTPKVTIYKKKRETIFFSTFYFSNSKKQKHHQ